MVTRPTHRSRLVGLLCLSTVAALILAACGGDDQASDDDRSPAAVGDLPSCPVDALDGAEGNTEITIWHAWVGMTARTIEAIARDYNASQDRVTVSVEAQGTYEELLAKYEATLADPSGLPDLVLSEDTTTQFMIDTGVIVPATACIEADEAAAEFYDQVLPAVTAGWTVEDVLWPGSFTVSQPVLYINEAHFEAAGLDPADPPETLAEMREAAETIAAATSTTPALASVNEPLVLRLDSWMVENALSGVAQPVVNNDNGRSGLATESELDNDRTAEALGWYQEMHRDGLLKAIPYSQPYDQLFAMALGSSSMLVDTSTAITSVNGAIEGTLTAEDLGASDDIGIDFSAIKLDSLRIGVSLNPGLEAPGRGQVGGSGWYVVDRGDDAKIAAAWDFLRFNNETDQQVRWTLEGSYLPVSESAREDAALLEEFDTTRRGRWLAAASEGLEELDPNFPGPVIGPYNLFRAEVRTALERITLGGEDIDTTIASTSEKFQRALDQYRADVGG